MSLWISKFFHSLSIFKYFLIEIQIKMCKIYSAFNVFFAEISMVQKLKYEKSAGVTSAPGYGINKICGATCNISEIPTLKSYLYLMQTFTFRKGK